MLEIYNAVIKNPLFKGIAADDFSKVFRCLSARTVKYKKGEIIVLSGDDVSFIGVILYGEIKIIKEDKHGYVSMLTELSVTEMFGEILTCADIKQFPVTIVAKLDTEILLLNNEKIITTCTASCLFHKNLIENMMRHIAKKNFIQNRKIEILSKRSIRERLVCFFEIQRNGAKSFNIPFNREEMAQYLCVDRSALSNELCKMRNEGIITFRKNSFTIL